MQRTTLKNTVKTLYYYGAVHVYTCVSVEIGTLGTHYKQEFDLFLLHEYNVYKYVLLSENIMIEAEVRNYVIF